MNSVSFHKPADFLQTHNLSCKAWQEHVNLTGTFAKSFIFHYFTNKFCVLLMTKTKTAWIVKAYTGYKTGWQELKRFDNPADADLWLCNYIRENSYSPADFTIIRK